MEAELVYYLWTEEEEPHEESVPSYDIYYYSKGSGFFRTGSAKG